MRRLVVAGLVLLVATSMGCSTSSGPTASESAAWAGFEERPRVELVSAEEVGRLDASVDLTMRGSGDAIDQAIEAAHFIEPLAPGMEQVQASLFEGDVEGLTHVRSASDIWSNAEGRMIYRHVVTGIQGDDIVLQVRAFTT